MEIPVAREIGMIMGWMRDFVQTRDTEEMIGTGIGKDHRVRMRSRWGRESGLARSRVERANVRGLMVGIERLGFLHLCGMCQFSVHHLEFGFLFHFNYCPVFLIPSLDTWILLLTLAR